MTSRRLLLVASLIVLVAPVAAAAVVLFGGATIGNCHATVGDGTPRPACPVQVVVLPLIRTNEGLAISLALCAVAWFVANYVVLAHVVNFDRPRLKRVATGVAFVAVGAAAAGFLEGLSQRLRYAVDGGITWGLAGLLLAWIVAVAWVGLRPGTIVPRVTPRSTGRP